jgi:O-antigen/teichoic acid export membrane protein
VCGPTVVHLIAGAHFGPAIVPLRVLGFGLVFIFMTNGLSTVCLARGFTNRLFLISLVSLIINIALNIAAIPRLGINGAAEATLICEVLSMGLMMNLVSSQVKVRPKVFQALARPSAAGLITCVVLAPVYLRHGLGDGIGIALIPGVCVVYFGILVVLRGVPVEVRSVIQSKRRAKH